MGTGTLTIDLDAIAANWRALDALSGPATETAAVVKADGYGLGAARVAGALARAGVRRFFVAVADEGAEIRQALGPNAEICVFNGHMPGDTDMIGDLGLVPMLNSTEQTTRHLEALPGHPFGVQLDTGMNRLGMGPAEWAAVAEPVLDAGPHLLMSHLACVDDPAHPQNAEQLRIFREMTEGTGIPRSLAATGGILLGPDYHFDVTRPGIGLYGGLPYADATPVAHLSLPVVQTQDVEPGQRVGYGATWTADAPARIATISGGYADGLDRYLSNTGQVFHEGTPCPIVGRVSMDLITVDITHLDVAPVALDVLSVEQTINDLAETLGTISNEILTDLGARYRRKYLAGAGA